MNEAFVIDVSTEYPDNPIGTKKFTYLPRVGEWIDIKKDSTDLGTIYLVLMVAHSDQGGSDIYVRPLKQTQPELIRGLRSR